jgi:hypothetical protein
MCLLCLSSYRVLVLISFCACVGPLGLSWKCEGQGWGVEVLVWGPWGEGGKVLWQSVVQGPMLGSDRGTLPQSCGVGAPHLHEPPLLRPTCPLTTLSMPVPSFPEPVACARHVGCR